MNVEKYNLKASSKGRRYEFISEGPKGAIRKLIEFQETQDEGLFNLAFGDKTLLTEEIDDLSVTDNGDTEKVLATVVAAVYAFCNSILMLISMHQAALNQEQGCTVWASQNTLLKCSRTFICLVRSAMSFLYFSQALLTMAF